ncbi:histidine kinase [Paenibacillus sp. JX-17]|uniref:Histidine kinase n=1 Tax=Paenibacillus lacisoli TaxID=3064525 RepID=A0ABT9CBN6_9BACL|nr:sensor histidine kinase [Paenibacillus sp. JX-17]MDO7906674.1 histidine kinase [Paenibacillus sp. JX-17]
MKFRSIRSRLIQFMLLAVIVPLVLSMTFTFLQTKHSLREQSVAENERLIYQGATNIDNYLDSINRASIVIYSDPDFLLNMAKIPDDYRAVAEIYTTLQTIMNTVPGVTQVYLHSFESNQSTLVTSTVPQRDTRWKAYTGRVPYDENGIYFQPAHQSDNYGFKATLPKMPEQLVFTYHRSIERVPAKEKLGVLAIDVSLARIRNICSQLFDAEEEKLYLVDGKGTIIYSGDESKIGTQLQDTKLTTQLREDSSHGYFEEDSTGMHVYQKLNSGLTDWSIVKQIPAKTLYHRATQLTQVNSIIAGAALVIVILGTLFISIRITGPIQQLTRYMNVIQKTGQLDMNITVKSHDEIGVLFRRFRQLMDTVNNLILREYKLELANKTNQLKALQAQINPHFLYNALQSIGTLALQQQGARVYSLLSSLSKIMRYSMRGGALVTLRDEADHMKQYLELQQERFGDQLQITMNWAEDTLDVPLPKMVLQPLVENYFKHGAEPLYGPGELTLTSRMIAPGRLQIIIENNGSPIPDDQLLELRERLSLRSSTQNDTVMDNHDPAAEEHIGLSNVLQRLKLYSDGKALLQVDNIQPHGVRYILEIDTTAMNGYREDEKDESVDR